VTKYLKINTRREAMIKLIKFFVIMFSLSTFCFQLSTLAYGDTHPAADCSQSAVQSAINAAIDGDTVTVPAGTATWSSAVSITNKTITLQGAGSGGGGTKIIYGGTNHVLIGVDAGTKTGKMDISGFWLYGGDSNYWNGTAMQLYGPVGWKNLRVHHMVFDSNMCWTIKFGAYTCGLLDHCTFQGHAFGTMGYGKGAADWAAPLTLGTADFFFVEDNTFNPDDFYGQTGVPLLDMDSGGRIVTRYNNIKYGMWETHDKARSGLPSANAYEIYNNTFWTNTDKWKGIDISAGTGVVWGNTFTGNYSFAIGGMDYKSFDPRSCKLCDGTDSADQNVAGQSGWRCQYQIGSMGEGSTAYGYPLYLWNNTKNGSAVGMTCTDGCNHVQASRDFYNNGTTPKPGYTPYIYPHPLQGGGDTTPPANIASVNDGTGSDIAFTVSTTQLQANWTASSDPEGFSGYKYAIGTTAGASNITNWTTLGNVLTVTKTGLSLAVGTTYYFSVKAFNPAGLESAVTNSNGQFVKGDTTPPGAPAAVRDGTGADAAYTALITQLSANWDAAFDPESSIAKYYYAIGTTPGSTNVTGGWTDNGTGLSVTQSGLSLTVGTTYYFSVKAQNGTGLQGAAVNSTGICVVAQGNPGSGPVITGVDVTNLTDRSATIVWDTDLDTKGQVQYGTTLNYIGGGEESELGRRHMVDIKSLDPETRYHYRVVNIDGGGNTTQSGDYTFKTYALINRAVPIVGKVYPNPYKLAEAGQLTFSLSSATGGNIRIYTLSGKLVKDIPVTSGTTDALWNMTNESGNRINGGLYVYIMSDSDGNKKTGKIVITN
jgi:hypothetical protein